MLRKETGPLLNAPPSFMVGGGRGKLHTFTGIAGRGRTTVKGGKD